jgi:hypothetical protein
MSGSPDTRGQRVSAGCNGTRAPPALWGYGSPRDGPQMCSLPLCRYASPWQPGATRKHARNTRNMPSDYPPNRALMR